MTRKDTILIAVVINAGLLAVLFTTAVIYDTDKNNEPLDFSTSLAQSKMPSSDPAPSLIASASTGDEVDNVLKYYTSPPAQPTVLQPSEYLSEEIALRAQVLNDEEALETEHLSPQENVIEVTVKRGDVLEKIAKVHRTTVGAIKRANQLESERLSVGQVLKIPVKQASRGYVNDSTSMQSGSHLEKKPENAKDTQLVEPVYYTIKSGDNPWKIARQFGVKYDEVLRLNNLDEEKARNLKIGDRIRVK